MIEVYGKKGLFLKMLNRVGDLVKRRKGFLVSEAFYSGYRQELISKGLAR